MSIRTFDRSRLILASLFAVLAAGPAAQAQKILHTSTGSGAPSEYGTTALAGDLDHDGKQDLLVGAPTDDSAGPDAGRVWVLSGASGNPLLSLSGAAAGEQFGRAVAGVGDTDGDGTPDLLIGAPGLASTAGAARLFSGANGALLHAFSGGQIGDRFGAAVGGVHDADGDGLADLLIGAPGTDGTGPNGTDAGKVFVYAGDSGQLLQSIGGSNAGDGLGASVGNDGSGVLFIDSEPDILIGLTQDGAGGNGAGAVHVHRISDYGLTHVLTGGAAGDGFGRSVSRAGDVDHDGTGDIVIGSNAGYARVHSGSTGALLATYSGNPATGFGATAAGVGDVNGDTWDDIAIGEPLADEAGTNSGSLHLFSGNGSQGLYVVHGPGPEAQFGASITCAGDLNADTLLDVAAGAPGPGPSGSSPGQVFTLSFTPWEDVGAGLVGISGIPYLQGQGGLVASTQVNLTLSGARTLAGVTLVLGTSTCIDATHSVLTPLPEIVTPGLLTNSAGSLNYSFTWPGGMPQGQTVYYQFRVIDPAAPGGEALSNTLAATVP